MTDMWFGRGLDYWPLLSRSGTPVPRSHRHPACQPNRICLPFAYLTGSGIAGRSEDQRRQAIIFRFGRRCALGSGREGTIGPRRDFDYGPIPQSTK
jgi:hypothetical protein